VIAALEELDFVLLHLNMPELTAVSVAYQDNCEAHGGTTAQCADSFWAPGATSGTQTNSVLVNGMTVKSLSVYIHVSTNLSIYILHQRMLLMKCISSVMLCCSRSPSPRSASDRWYP
jgi:hypothetical protein